MLENRAILLILTALASVFFSVIVLGYYGYLHMAKPDDARLLAEYTWYKSVEGENKVAKQPAAEVATCVEGVLLLAERDNPLLSGVLLNDKRQAVRCQFSHE